MQVCNKERSTKYMTQGKKKTKNNQEIAKVRKKETCKVS